MTGPAENYGVPMSKSRPFSIYLLKPGYDVTNTLTGEHHLTQVEAGTLPQGASLFILDSQPSDPWWKSYFGVQMALKQASKSALLFLPIDDRCFALSFGHAHHNLKDESRSEEHTSELQSLRHLVC